ncbi:MAG TPA: KH domain-containing protein [Candidatus Saccharimonadales bacterium]|nr:KH domain-containing protein [Candidatus Saccharimonadales bacterium]
MSEIDQQFIEYVVKSLVSKPDAVHIDRSIDEKGVLLQLTVDPEDLGRVIGKRGATAQSLRTLLRALGTKNDARYNLKIVDNSPEGQAAPAPPDKKSAPEDRRAEQPDDEAPEETDTAEVPPPEEEPEEENETGDRLAQARKELADLDDLDV